jgi:hypothetical protein
VTEIENVSRAAKVIENLIDFAIECSTAGE